MYKAELTSNADSETTKEAPLKDNMYYIGSDIHKKTISYCAKDQSGPHQPIIENKVASGRLIQQR